jgi:hypothetical protein
LGLNLDYGATPPEGSFKDQTRSWFLAEANPLGHHFGQDDARFGCYMSKDFHSARLKLTILPMRIAAGGELGERLRLKFNFHADLEGATPEEVSPRVQKVLGAWREYRDIAVTLTQEIENRDRLS